MYTWWCRAICSDWICHAALEAEKLSMTIHSPSPNILLHPQYNQQIPLLQYHHHPLSLSNNASKAAVHSLYISIPCRQTADVWRFEAKGGWFSGEIWFCQGILAWGCCNSKCWHRNVIPLFHPLLSRGNSISQSQAMDPAITSNYETHTLFLFFHVTLWYEWLW